MMMSSFVSRRWTMAIVYLILFGSFAVSGVGQDEALSIPAPAAEEFSAASGIVIPRRFLYCLPPNESIIVRSDCERKNPPEERRVFNWLPIYHADGEVWFTLKVVLGRTDGHYPGKVKDFKPFSEVPGALVMRLSAESEHWYEVEVDEDTRETKYVSKVDGHWMRTTFHTLFEGRFVHVGRGTKIFDAPDGTLIEERAADHLDARYLRLNGDWMLLEFYSDLKKVYQGWIRWQDGRRVLIGSAYNHWKIPDVVDRRERFRQ